MTWEQEYAIKKAKRAEFAQKHGITPPDAFYGPRKEFQITSGAVRVTDPCYSPETWCAGTQQNVLNGTWLGWSRNVHDDWSWDSRIDELVKTGFDPSADVKSYEEIAKELIAMVKAEPISNDRADRLNFLEKHGQHLHKHVGARPHTRINVASLILHVVSDLYTEEQTIEDFVQGMERAERWDHQPNPSRIFQKLKDKVTGYRQAMITVIHEDYKNDPRFFDENILETIYNQGKVSDIDVGVDSGQAGIFDLELFGKYAATEDHGDDTPEHERFYNACCDIACGEDSYRRREEDKKGIVISSGPVTVDDLTFGYNSSSGEGDGSYTLRYIEDENGKVIMMNIMFMTPEQYYSDEDADLEDEKEVL